MARKTEEIRRLDNNRDERMMLRNALFALQPRAHHDDSDSPLINLCGQLTR